MKKNPALAAYMNCTAEEGLDLDRFVEHGARLLTPAESASLTAGLNDLSAKIRTLRSEHNRLADQLDLLVDFYLANSPGLPDQVRSETIFALLYALNEADLVPDDEPEVGYLDDQAVVESVLSRHPAVFESHCLYRQIEWSTVAPEQIA
jgi:uncharacterized membrane protein YkvA (DUF1232 family)